MHNIFQLMLPWVELGSFEIVLLISVLIFFNQAPTARGAVTCANGSNQLTIIIPCHRVINANGELGGYAGGITRKQWLLDHEKKYKTG